MFHWFLEDLAVELPPVHSAVPHYALLSYTVLPSWVLGFTQTLCIMVLCSRRFKHLGGAIPSKVKEIQYIWEIWDICREVKEICEVQKVKEIRVVN